MGKELVSLGGELVGVRGLAAAPPAAALAHEPVALQGRQVASDAVVGEMQRLGKLVDSPTGTAQQQDDTTAGRREEPGTPITHSTPPPSSIAASRLSAQ